MILTQKGNANFKIIFYSPLNFKIFQKIIKIIHQELIFLNLNNLKTSP